MMDERELMTRAYEIGLLLIDEDKYSFNSEELTEIFRYRYRCRIPFEKYGYTELEDMLDACDLFQRVPTNKSFPMYKCSHIENYIFKHKLPVRPPYIETIHDEDTTSPDINDSDFSVMSKKATEVNLQARMQVVHAASPFSKVIEVGYRPCSPVYRPCSPVYRPCSSAAVIPNENVTEEVDWIVKINIKESNDKVKEWLAHCPDFASPIPSSSGESPASAKCQQNSSQANHIKGDVSLVSLTNTTALQAGGAIGELIPIPPPVPKNVTHFLPPNLEACLLDAILNVKIVPKQIEPAEEVKHEEVTLFEQPCIRPSASSAKTDDTVPTPFASYTKTDDLVPAIQREQRHGSREKQTWSRRRPVPATSSNAEPLGCRRERRLDRITEGNQHITALPKTSPRSSNRRRRRDSPDRRDEDRKRQWVRPPVRASDAASVGGLPARASGAIVSDNPWEELFHRHGETNHNSQDFAMASLHPPPFISPKSRSTALIPTPNPFRPCLSIEELAMRLKRILIPSLNVPLSIAAVSDSYRERHRSSFSTDFCNNVADGTMFNFLEHVSRGEIRVSYDDGLVLFSLAEPAHHLEMPPRERLEDWRARNDPVPTNLYGRDRAPPVRERHPFLMPQEQRQWTGNWTTPPNMDDELPGPHFFYR